MIKNREQYVFLGLKDFVNINNGYKMMKKSIINRLKIRIFIKYRLSYIGNKLMLKTMKEFLDLVN